MSFYLNAKSIALEGIGFGTRAVAILGFKWFSVEIINPPPELGGGFGVGGPKLPTFIQFTFRLNGKVVRKRFEVSDSGIVVKLVAKLLGVVKVTVLLKNQVVNAVKPSLRLNKVEYVTPKIVVAESTPEIKVRRIK